MNRIETKEELIQAFRTCMSEANGKLLDNKKNTPRFHLMDLNQWCAGV